MSSAAPALLDTLRRRIADVVVETPEGRGWGTGLAALDAALAAQGGVPRGRLTEVLGAPGSGVTTLLRRLVRGALAGGAWVAVVDATRTLAPRDWAALAPHGLWVVRPDDPARAAWCADVLLRSGAFGLVVLDGAPVLARAVAMRLLQLARDADAALVCTGAGTRASDLGGALRLRVQRRAPAAGVAPPGAPPVAPAGASANASAGALTGASAGLAPGAPRGAGRLVITIEKGGTLGTHRTLEVSCAVGVARRLCAHPEVPDRRPVAGPAARGRRSGAGGAPDVPDAGPGPAGPPARDHAPIGVPAPPLRRSRRCAEPPPLDVGTPGGGGGALAVGAAGVGHPGRRAGGAG